MTESWPKCVVDRLTRVVDLHFDPLGGSPYWLECQVRLGMDVRREIRSPDDLALLGSMDEAALATRPIEDFLPRSVLERRSEIIVAETAGTLGAPKFAVHRRDEFEEAFVAPFVAAAVRAGFPRQRNWLFIGPSGPHVIAKAARRCAEAMGSCDPFAVDLDPRWAKKLPSGSFGWQRYVQHVMDQALSVLAVQDIGVIFATPVLLEALGPRMSAEQRDRVEGMHLGGLAVSAEQRSGFAEHFPHAVVLSGYGNTLFGMMPELAYDPTKGIEYYPHGGRVIAQVIEDSGGEAPRLDKAVAYGQRGRVVLHRLDEAQLIVNLIERDSATRVAPPPGAAEDGFAMDGLRDPQPIVTERVKPAIGLY